ncbi:MAG: NAD-dependent epimerase/dehydratase [Ilumatobacteraceae bacterium]|nr:NAD-dependent epimerase/dehydratase [Ilumatobacteraceae bacterium]
MSPAHATTLITGGAGFIGTNMAARVLRQGGKVVVLDDLSRTGVVDNLHWLQGVAPRHRLRIEIGDVRDAAVVRRSLVGVDRVFHFAAQVAVTTSLVEPAEDFMVNAGGTLTVLEELRALPEPPPMLFTSTNKVYGRLDDVGVQLLDGCYAPTDATLRERGLSETRSLAFCSPYGCSKGAADQYVLDYARSYGLANVVFRMSCIYGPHQCGNEDQGWLAHFLRQSLRGAPITIYGDGRQVRDALYVDDLLDAMELALASSAELAGQAFNIGGGTDNAISLRELLDMIGSLDGSAPSVLHDGWRVADQRWFVSDTRAFADATGWRPQVRVADGVARLHAWLRDDATVAEAV